MIEKEISELIHRRKCSYAAALRIGSRQIQPCPLLDVKDALPQTRKFFQQVDTVFVHWA